MQTQRQQSDYQDEDEDKTEIQLLLLFGFMGIAWVLVIAPGLLVLDALRQIRTCTQWSPRNR